MEHVLAGAATGMFNRILSQPLDVVKVRFQLQVEPVTIYHPTSKYKSFGQAVKCIYIEEGLSAFWKGLGPALYLSMTYSAIQFASFEILSNYVWTYPPNYISDNTVSKLAVNFSCGAVSGTMATIGSFPFDVIRTRMIGQGNVKIAQVYRGIFDAAQTMLKKEGPRSFYKGLLPNLLHAFPASGLRFVLYKYLDDSWSKDKSKWDTFTHLSAGIVIGFTAKLMVYPLDVIKKRLQVQGFEEGRKHFGSFPTCYGLINCIRTIFREEGITGFYKGLAPCIAKSLLITFSYSFVYRNVSAFLALH